MVGRQWRRLLLDNDYADQMLTDLEGRHWWRGTGPYEAAPGPPKVGLFTEPQMVADLSRSHSPAPYSIPAPRPRPPSPTRPRGRERVDVLPPEPPVRTHDKKKKQTPFQREMAKRAKRIAKEKERKKKEQGADADAADTQEAQGGHPLHA